MAFCDIYKIRKLWSLYVTELTTVDGESCFLAASEAYAKLPLDVRLLAPGERLRWRGAAAGRSSAAYDADLDLALNTVTAASRTP